MAQQIATTKMSSKGQVVIPEDIRNSLGLAVGDQFVVTGQRDVIVFKRLNMPDMSAFDNIVERARKNAKRAGLKREDLNTAIKRVRRAR